MRVADLLQGFVDEIEKIAAPQRPEKPEKPESRVGSALAGAAAPIVANTAMAGAAYPFMNDRNRSGEETRNLAKRVHQGMGAPPEVTFQDTGHKPMAQAYDPINRKVLHSTGSREAVIAHELGHAKNYASKLRKPLMGGRALGTYLGGGTTAAITGAMAAGDKDPSWTPGLVNLGINAPILADEAVASGRALRYMTKQHGLLKGLAKSAPLAPAFGSYAAIAGTPLAITAYRKHKQKQKVAMIGALLGGAAGYMMPGSSLKTKAINTAVGAGLGHLAGKAIGSAKRGVWDEPRARAHRDLYGYQPSTVTNPELYQQQ